MIRGGLGMGKVEQRGAVHGKQLGRVDERSSLGVRRNPL